MNLTPPSPTTDTKLYSVYTFQLTIPYKPTSDELTLLSLIRRDRTRLTVQVVVVNNVEFRLFRSEH